MAPKVETKEKDTAGKASALKDKNLQAARRRRRTARTRGGNVWPGEQR